MIADRDLIRRLRHWIAADVIDFMDVIPSELGVPQGEAIPPLLANIYLVPLDKEFEPPAIASAWMLPRMVPLRPCCRRHAGRGFDVELDAEGYLR